MVQTARDLSANATKAAVLTPFPTQPALRSAARGPRWVALALLALLPSVAAAIYLWGMAQDQYASHFGFGVRHEQAPVDIGLAGLAGLAGAANSDTDLVYAYLTSEEIVRDMAGRVDLRAAWHSGDAVFGRDPGQSAEQLFRRWQRMVRVRYDSRAGLIRLRVLAFSAPQAQKIAQAVLQLSTAKINALSAIAQEDILKHARAELKETRQQLREARVALGAFRARTQMVNPTEGAQHRTGLLASLEGQLAQAVIDLDTLARTTREGDGRLRQARNRVEVIEQRIGEERRKLTQASGAFAGYVAAVGEYERLAAEHEFASEAHESARSAYELARAQARRESLYLVPFQMPSMAQSSQFPRKWELWLLVSIASLLIWGILSAVVQNVRDRR